MRFLCSTTGDHILIKRGTNYEDKLVIALSKILYTVLLSCAAYQKDAKSFSGKVNRDGSVELNIRVVASYAASTELCFLSMNIKIQNIDIVCVIPGTMLCPVDLICAI